MSSSSQTQTQQHNKRKRIVINIDKSGKRPKHPNEDSESMFNPNRELPKLFQISQRCFHYYDKFKEDRLQEQQYMEVMFRELLLQLQNSFRELVQNISAKQAQIRNCVLDKKKQFMSFHPLHFLSLTEKIQVIREQKSFLEKVTQPSNIFSINYNSQCEIKQSQLSEFAKILNDFYQQIQTIQRVNFKQNIKESVGFLKNLIQDECSSYLNRKIADQPSETPQENISFNNDQLFSVKEFHEQSSQYLWEQFRANTQRSQRDRELKIEGYGIKMSRMKAY